MNKTRWPAVLLTLASLCAGPALAKDAAVYAQAQQARADATILLERLVNIDSGTGSEAGVDKVGAIVAAELRALGARIELSPSGPGMGQNILATFQGKGRKKLLVMAHLDTVFGAGTVARRPFKIVGERAYGPGIADDKGGIVAALFALKILKAVQFDDYERITLLFNTNEETGSAGTRGLIEQQAKLHDVIINVEPGRPADGLVVWRKGSGELLVETHGKSSHAGNAPEAGRNAVTEMSHQTLQMAALNDKVKQTSVNFTVVRGGDRLNVIPDAAAARADVRAATPAEFDRVERDAASMAEHKLIPDVRVSTKLIRNFPPMPRNSDTDRLAVAVQAVYDELGLKLTLEGSGGASDSGFSTALGRPTIDGMGLVGGGFHADDEYLELDSIVPRLYLLARVLMTTRP
ncbi:MAG: glutamate carboxypeptidase [Pseudomonadota bacterium]